MKKLLVMTAVVFGLTACGGEPVDPEQQAIDNIRSTGQVADGIADSEITELLRETCDVLDNYTPQEFGKAMVVPDNITEVVLESATMAYCPDHRREVEEYLAG